MAVDGEVVPRGEWTRPRCATARRSRCCTPCRAGRRRRSRSPAARSTSRLILGTGGFRSLEVMAAAAARVGRRAGDGGDAAGGPERARVDPRGARRRRARGAAQHGRLLHRARGRHDRAAGARGARHRLGQARGDRRRPHAAAGPRRAARGGRDARGRGLHGAALHERRPDPGAPARGRRLRRGDAARLADRQRDGHQQPLQPAPDRRGRRRAGDPRRGRRHGVRRGAGDGGRLRRGAARQRDLARGRPGRDGARDAQGGRGRLRGGARPAASRGGSTRRPRRPRRGWRSSSTR